MNKFTKAVADLFKTRRALVLVSLLLSFLIWYSLTIYYNPVSTRTIRNVPIMFNTSETAISGMGLEIVSYNIDSVDVVVTGKTANVQRVSASDITITPSVVSITEAGEYTVALNYTKAMMSDFEIVSIQPETVTLYVDSVVSREFSVTAVADGVSVAESETEEKLYRGSPTVTDLAYHTLTVKGARSDIDRIDEVIARTYANEKISTRTNYDADIILLDSDGNEISQDGLTLSFTEANITVPIYMFKTVDVNVVFKNSPAQLPFDYTLDVEQIEIRGEPSIIKDITRIDTVPIDLGAITTSTKELALDLVIPNPDYIKVDGDIKSVNATLKWNKNIEKKTIQLTKFICEDFDSSIGTVSLDKSVAVTVYGIKDEIKQITADDLTLVLSLKNKTNPDGHVVDILTIKSSNDFKTVWGIVYDSSGEPFTANITITK